MSSLACSRIAGFKQIEKREGQVYLYRIVFAYSTLLHKEQRTSHIIIIL